MWKFTVESEWQNIWGDEYQERWLRILETSPYTHVFFHPTLVRVWVDSYLTNRKMLPIFVWGKAGDGTEVFFPLILWYKNWKHAFYKVIVPVGFSDYDYHDPLFSREIEEVSKQSFWQKLTELLSLYNVDELCIDGIRDALVHNNHKWEREVICPHLNLAQFSNEAELYSFLKPDLRRSTKRRMRRLNEINPLTVVEYDGNVPDSVYLEFINVHSKKWPNAYKAPGFHKKMIDNCSLQGPIHFSTLRLGEINIAWCLGFKYHSVFYYYMAVSDPEYASYAPSAIHLCKLVLHAIGDELLLFDLLRGDESYKNNWSNAACYVYCLKIQSDRFASRLKRVFNYIKDKLVKIV